MTAPPRHLRPVASSARGLRRATMPTIYSPSPVIVPATGPATAGGHTLFTYQSDDMAAFARPGDSSDPYDAALARASRARRDGFLLCLRPTADRPACVDIGAHAFADASLQSDFVQRALVVDPYDADGEDIRDRAPLAEVAAAA